MQSEEIRKRFFKFFLDPKRAHKETPNVSLVPENDSTLLFVNSGMFPLVPYLLGEKNPLGKRIFNFQRCIRFEDIEDVGDNRHTTFFEMMGNWSLGDYFKKEQIPWVAELHFSKEFYGIDPKKIYVSVFSGEGNIPKDIESIELWKESFKKFGVKAEFSEDIYVDFEKYPEKRIFAYGMKKNWWQRGNAPGELGGPDSEIFYDTGKKHNPKFGEKCHINCDCGRFLEIGNSVFIQYRLNENLEWEELPQKNVDFGGGFERVVAVLQGKDDIFQTDLFSPIVGKIEEIFGVKYGNKKDEDFLEKGLEEMIKVRKDIRILADHIRSASFLIMDGVAPSNKEQGYILRRLIRRSLLSAKNLLKVKNRPYDKRILSKISESVIEKMKYAYPKLDEMKEKIFLELEKEAEKFEKTLEKGIKEVEKIKKSGIEINGDILFHIFETYGFPPEIALEVLEFDGDKKKIMEEFKEEEKSHQELSRTTSAGMFKGGLAYSSEIMKAYHTVTHILLKSLQIVLGNHVHQMGSNINSERARFDFSHPEKVSESELKKVEDLANEVLEKEYIVEFSEMKLEEAKKIGAEGVFSERYGEVVKVYKIFEKDSGKIFSMEICGGPHVQNTKKDILEKFGKVKIDKEESVGSGVRRVRVVFVKV